MPSGKAEAPRRQRHRRLLPLQAGEPGRLFPVRPVQGQDAPKGRGADPFGLRPAHSGGGEEIRTLAPAKPTYRISNHATNP